MPQYHFLLSVNPSFSGKFGKILEKFQYIFKNFIGNFRPPRGYHPYPLIPPTPHIYTYIPTRIVIIPLQIDLSQSRVGIFPPDRYKPIGLHNSTRRFLPERTLPEHFFELFFWTWVVYCVSGAKNYCFN